MSESYIKQRKGGGLAFNIKIPRGISHHFPTASGRPGTHITIGLGTREMAVAVPKARMLAVRWKAEFDRLVIQPATDPKDPGRLYDETLTRHLQPGIKDDAARLAQTAKLAEETIAIQNELDRRGIESYDPVPPDLRARMDALADARRILRGHVPENVDSYAPLFAAASRRFLDAWQRKRSKAGLPTDAARQYEPALRLFTDYIGPKPLKDIVREDVERYATILAGFDRDWGRSRRMSGAGFWDLKARYGSSQTPIGGQAVKRHLQSLAMLWEWADREGLVARYNPFASVAQRYGGKSLPALAFTDDDIARLFTAPLAADLHEAMQLALHSGMRAREIAALRADDFVTREGIICIAIRAGSYPRRVPIAPALGWLVAKYAELPRDMPLWPSLQRDRNGKDLVKVFGDFKRTRGFASRQKGFQSFQKTIKQHFEKKAISKEIWFALVGMRGASPDYRPAPPPLVQIVEALAGLDYPDNACSPPGQGS